MSSLSFSTATTLLQTFITLCLDCSTSFQVSNHLAFYHFGHASNSVVCQVTPPTEGYSLLSPPPRFFLNYEVVCLECPSSVSWGVQFQSSIRPLLNPHYDILSPEDGSDFSLFWAPRLLTVHTTLVVLIIHVSVRLVICSCLYFIINFYLDCVFLSPRVHNPVLSASRSHSVNIYGLIASNKDELTHLFIHSHEVQAQEYHYLRPILQHCKLLS